MSGLEKMQLKLPIGVCDTCKHCNGWQEEGQSFRDCTSKRIPETLLEYYDSELGTPDFQCPFWELRELSFCIFHRVWYEDECMDCMGEYYAEEEKIRKYGSD